MPKGTYEATVMLRITSEFTERLDKAVESLTRTERAQGRARKIGRATIVHEAMKRGLPILEAEINPPAGEPDNNKESF